MTPTTCTCWGPEVEQPLSHSGAGKWRPVPTGFSQGRRPLDLRQPPFWPFRIRGVQICAMLQSCEFPDQDPRWICNFPAPEYGKLEGKKASIGQAGGLPAFCDADKAGGLRFQARASETSSSACWPGYLKVWAIVLRFSKIWCLEWRHQATLLD